MTDSLVDPPIPFTQTDPIPIGFDKYLTRESMKLLDHQPQYQVDSSCLACRRFYCPRCHQVLVCHVDPDHLATSVWIPFTTAFERCNRVLERYNVSVIDSKEQ